MQKKLEGKCKGALKNLYHKEINEASIGVAPTQDAYNL